MATFKVDIQGFLNLIVGDNGFVASLNCLFLGENIKRVREALCYGFAAPIFWFGMYVGCLGCCGCCTIPTTVNLIAKYGKKGKEGGD